MAKSFRSQRSPVDGRTGAALSILAEAILGDFFIDDENQERYYELIGRRRAARGKSRGPATVGTMELPENGVARVEMPEGDFDVDITISHPTFETTIAVSYVVEITTMVAAEVTRFKGDRRKALAMAEQWLKEFGDVDDNEHLPHGLPSIDGSLAANDDNPGEPPPPSPADKALVEGLADVLAREMKKRLPNLTAHEKALLALEDCPQALWPILDGLVAACASEKRDDATVAAWQFLLEHQLISICHRIETGRDWASRMGDEFTRKLTEIGEAGVVSPEDFTMIANSLAEAGIDLADETRVALADAGLSSGAAVQLPGLMQGMMRTLIDQMAALSESPFDVISSVNEAMGVMPSEIDCYLAHEFAHSPHAMLRDAVPLMLLSNEPDVRRTAAAALEQTAAPDTMSPETLRRMIAVRNWIPEADRAGLDRAIRQARVKNVACAEWPQAQEVSITATTIDGAGAQSIVMVSPGRARGILAGLLLKMNSGVSDSWCGIDATRRDKSGALSTQRQAAVSSMVERAYLDTVVRHALAVNTMTDEPPGSDFLHIAELIGGADWRAERLDIAAEAERLFDALPEAQRSSAAIEASFKRSGDWINTDLGESWFLDDAEVHAIVKKGSRRGDAAVSRLIAEILPKQRDSWAERFLLLALRARAARDLAQRAQAADFAILAHGLCDDRDLKDIPLMVAIARHTIEVARADRW